MGVEKQEPLSDEEKIRVLGLLEEQGQEKWSQRWKTHMAFPQNLAPETTNEEERERVVRYLLLRVLINQQAKFEKVREMSIRVSEEFTDTLLFEPFRIDEAALFEVFYEIAGEKGSDLYKVGALGGIRPLSLFAYRFKAFEGFVRWLAKERKRLYEVAVECIQADEAKGLFRFLNTHPVLRAGWVGNDPKACRMFVNWIVFMFCEIWNISVGDMKDTMMIVDGHVGKVVCRTGLLEKVNYESKRPFIIEASKMRKRIEEITSPTRFIPFYVDNGAFYLFEDGFCVDLNPDCDNCPISHFCKKYTKWTAYKRMPV